MVEVAVAVVVWLLCVSTDVQRSVCSAKNMHVCSAEYEDCCMCVCIGTVVLHA